MTRAKRGMEARRVYSNPVDRSTGLICDQFVILTGFYPVRNYPELLRRIKYKHAESGKTLICGHLRWIDALRLANLRSPQAHT